MAAVTSAAACIVHVADSRQLHQLREVGEGVRDGPAEPERRQPVRVAVDDGGRHPQVGDRVAQVEIGDHRAQPARVRAEQEKLI